MNENSNLNIIKDLLIFLFKVDKLTNDNLNYIYKSSELKILSNNLNNIPNKDLIDITYRHKLIEFIFENNFIKLYMKEFHEKFRLIYKSIYLKNLKNIMFTKKILQLFNEKKIKVIVLKGMALSLQTKGTYTSRISGDLDLFISQKDLIKSLKILNDSGYLIKHNYFPNEINDLFISIFKILFYEITLENKSNDFHFIDLHWKLTNYNSILPNFEIALRRSKLISHQNIKINSLNKIDSLKFSCANVAKDKWTCLSNLLDIHFLAKGFPQSKLSDLIKDKEIRISLYATYLITKDEHYNFSRFLNIFDRFYITRVCKKFQSLDSKSKGLSHTSGIDKFISLVHEFYLANSLKDIVLLNIRIIWHFIPTSFKLKFRNTI